MSSFDKSQTRKKRKRKTKATAKKMTMMTTQTTTATRRRQLNVDLLGKKPALARFESGSMPAHNGVR